MQLLNSRNTSLPGWKDISVSVRHSKQTHFIWASMYLAQKYYYCRHYFNISNWRLDHHFMWSFQPCKCLLVVQRECLHFLMILRPCLLVWSQEWTCYLSLWSQPLYTDWANPATEIKKSLCPLIFTKSSGFLYIPRES